VNTVRLRITTAGFTAQRFVRIIGKDLMHHFFKKSEILL